MANFPTHIAVGTVVSGALATVTLAADVLAPENIVAVTLAGVLGSVLPDIDLKDSRPSRAMFSGLAVFFSFAVLFSLGNRYSIAEMLVLWLGTLVLVRYLARAVFHHLSYHRGIWHSLLAAAFCACITAWVYYRLLGRHEGVAWLAAGFMMIGYITHLVLDEIYSVDVMDTRVKASFGSALKLIDHKHPGHSTAMAIATVLAFLATPPTKTFVEGIKSRELWTALQHRLLPRSHWFGVDWRGMAWLPDLPLRPKGPLPASTNTMVTGSIASEAAASTAEPPLAEALTEALLAEAERRVSRGDVAGARDILASLQSEGGGRAAFALAETYDPNMLASWDARGVKADAGLARELYANALEHGIGRAQARLDDLR